MSLDDFIKEYGGVYLEFDGAFKYQCQDLAKAWEASQNWPVISGNANQVINNAPDFYEKVSDPRKGDLVIWNIGQYGHIAVFVEKDSSDTFISFDQNYPIGSSCHLQRHDYNNIIGYLRPKGEDMGFTDDEARGMFDAVRHDFLGQNPDKAQIEADLNAAKGRQASGGYPLSDFVHDRFKELPPKDCSKEISEATKGLIRPEDCPAPAKDCSKEIAQAVEQNTITLRKNLEEIEGLYGQCQKDLETCKAQKTITYKLDFWDFVKSIFKRSK